MSDYPSKMDPFLLKFDADEVRIAAEFLSNWLPFLTRGLCKSCTRTLSDGIRSLNTEGNSADAVQSSSDLNHNKGDHGNCSAHSHSRSVGSTKDTKDNHDDEDTHSLGSWKDECEISSEHVVEASTSSPSLKKSWADMAMEDELAAEEGNDESNGVDNGNGYLANGTPVEAKPKVELSRDEREQIRFNNVERKKDFISFERVGGKFVNILDGLELHKGVFSAAEQKRIVSYVEDLQQMGRDGKLKERTYTAPRKWMKGKGRVTLQFGCCYNYARDKDGNPPGILKNQMVDPLPQLFRTMIKRLIRWHVLPPSCVPDSCIVNIYDEGDCIPPHIDNHEFVRPFCTVSFLSECNILFGSNLDILGPGEFAGSFAIPLPLGSVLVLNGNGADVAKHCVPAVPSKRISITFRKMDESKRPYGYVPDPDMQGLQPLTIEKDRSQRYDASRNRRFLRKPVGSDDRTDKGRPHMSENSSPRHSGRPRQEPVHRIRFGNFDN